jgi:hypothetical protein
MLGFAWPTFRGVESTSWLIVLLVVGATALTCVTLLYSYERKLVDRKLGHTLLLLRLASLSVIFFALFEPVSRWSEDLSTTGRVVVALDVSESMDTLDSVATDAEKLRWVKGLGMLGRGDGAERVDQWIDAYDKNQEPSWVDPQESSDVEKRRVLATSRKEMVQGLMAEVSKLTRYEIARRLLVNGNDPLLKQLQDEANVELCVFAANVASTDPASLAKVEKAEANGNGTDITQPLNAAVEGAGGGKLAGVIIFSDGRDNLHGSDPRYVQRFGGLAPVYPVLIGSDKRPQDLAIAGLDVPSTVFQDDTPVAKGVLRTSGYDGKEVTVVLEKQDPTGKLIGEPQRKTIRVDGPSAEVPFDLDAKDVGRQLYTMRVEPLPGETRDDNNSRSFSMQVVDDKADILALEGEARWEFRYINDALKRDNRLKVDTILFEQPYMGVLNDSFFPRSLTIPPQIDAASPSPFAKYDMVLLGDVSSRDLTTRAWEFLDRYVRVEGGTLVMVAGKNAFPLGYKSDIVEGLLPVTNLKVKETTGATHTGTPLKRGFHLHLTSDGEGQSMLQFDGDPNENQKIWKDLPGHLWGLVGEAKPAASVWAALETPPGDKDTPALDWERKNAMMVQQFVGNGQVVWLGIDSTWRWRFRVGDKFHHRFWGQFARWAAESKAAAGNEFFKLSLERPTISLGEDAVIRVRWDEKFLQKSPGVEVQAIIEPQANPDDRNPISPVTVDLQAVRPLTFEGRAPNLKSGEYKVTLKVTKADVKTEGIKADLVVLPPTTGELADVSANRGLLQQVANVSGGRLFTPDQIREIAPLFRDVNQTLHKEGEEPLWNRWWVLFLFCGIVMTEWVLRKVNGLP